MGERWKSPTLLECLPKRAFRMEKNNVRNAALQIKAIKNRLKDILDFTRDPVVAEEKRSLLAELNILWKEEEIFWRQRSRVQYLKGGDKNSNFFHTSTILRSHRNKVLKLLDDMNIWMTHHDDLQNHCVSFYRNLFQKRDMVVDPDLFRSIPCVVSDEMNQALCQPIEVEDIRKAVFELGAGKSPGPDGFPGLFYRNYWGTIGAQLEEVKDFFSLNAMPEEWNDTHLVLTPKIQHPERVSQFRPISCCNFRYKVISKIMTTRLNQWIPSLVSNLQATFTGEELSRITSSLFMRLCITLRLDRKGKSGK
ncbi:unnamed protein product [Linum trigynum]|uniref:Reverse transcriptase n=1 Tax=Linum trigynum TaxID=586398 RepID=A0AAV2DRD9_9ROSI